MPFSSCFRTDTPHVGCFHASATFLHGRSVFCWGWGRVAALRACSCHAGQRAGAVSPPRRGAPLDATVYRHGAGCLMPVDCRTADGGDVVPAVRTPRTAAASTRRQCLETSSPRWRRDKARQDEATRPGDKNRMWENKQPIFRSVWLLHCSCGLRNLWVCVTLYSSA